MKNYKSPDSIPILKRSANGNEDLCYGNVDKANCLNDFFTSVSTVDDSNIIIPPFQPVTESFIDNVHILRTDIEEIYSRQQQSRRSWLSITQTFKIHKSQYFRPTYLPYLIDL